MPGPEEFRELRYESADYYWTCQDGVWGTVFVGPNGNSIFFPAAGRRSGSEILDMGSECRYWLSLSYGGGDAWHMNVYHYSSTYFGYDHNTPRCQGLPVRAVFYDEDRFPEYIKDIKLIGGSKTETDQLKESYQNNGWTIVDYDLNKGCGGTSDYIYLLYKKERCVSGLNNGYFSDFVVLNNNDHPDGFIYNDRYYYPVPCDGSQDFINSNGDLNNNAGGKDIHLYYSRSAFPDNRAATAITVDDNQDGAVTLPSKDKGYDLNDEAGGNYVYMHFTTASCPY